MTPTDVVRLLDWRRRVAELYGRVRERYAEDPRAAWDDWRVTREQLYREHPQSPVPLEQRNGFALDLWAYDADFAFSARLEATPESGGRFAIGSSSSGTIDFVLVGRLDLGELGTLDAFWLDAYGGGLFVPFRDATSGAQTYAAGRYILDTAKGADLGVDTSGLPGGRRGRPPGVIVDFNFAYHPSCAWDPQWACPLAPPGNRLTAAVTAGEQLR